VADGSSRGRRYRRDDGLLVVGSAVIVVGSLLPWISGATRFIGTVHWTGLDDTSEGAMLIGLAIAILACVRWREQLAEIEPRIRWLPLGIAVLSALLWTIALRRRSTSGTRNPPPVRTRTSASWSRGSESSPGWPVAG